MPVGTDTEAVGDMPNVFTGLQGDIMAGTVCVEGHEAEVSEVKVVWGTLSGVLQGILRLALSLH